MRRSQLPAGKAARVLVVVLFLSVSAPKAAALGCDTWFGHVAKLLGRESEETLRQNLLQLRDRYETLLQTTPPSDPKQRRQHLKRLYRTGSEVSVAQNRLSRRTGRYLVSPLHPDYVGEFFGVAAVPSKVRYLNGDELGRFEITVDAEGRLRTADGALMDTFELLGDRASFVMTDAGKIYSTSDFEPGDAGDGLLRHSTFLRGLPVAAAGELVVRQGKIVRMTRKSGHYRSARALFDQFLAELKRRGVNTEGIDILEKFTD